MSFSSREQAGISAANFLQAADIFKTSENIACYLSYKHEFNSSFVIEAIWQAKKHCYVPVVVPDAERELIFARYRYGDKLHPNQYSILEPVHPHHEIPATELDLVMLPLTAFDPSGFRLGAGGGYYDNTFQFRREAGVKKPLLIGLCYAAQETDTVPKDPWDLKLDGVLTESGLHFFG